MLKNDAIFKRLLELPEELSETAKDSIIEQARYNTFARRGVVARYTLVNVLVAAGAFVCIASATFALVTLTPLAAAGPIPKALVSGLVIGCGVFLATLIQQICRARLLRPEIEQLLGTYKDEFEAG